MRSDSRLDSGIFDTFTLLFFLRKKKKLKKWGVARATLKPVSIVWPNPPLGQTGVAEPPPRLLWVVSTTPILLFVGGWTTPKGHGGDSAIPRPTIGVGHSLTPYLFIYFNLFFKVFNLFFKVFIIFN
jgi:hypothetical protein